MYYCRPLGSRLSPKCYKTARIRLRRPYYLASDVIVLEPKTSGIPVKRGTSNASVKQEPVDLNVKEETTDDFIDVENKINGSPATSVKQEPSDYIDVESNDGGTGGDGDEVDGCQRGNDVITVTASTLTNGSSKLLNRPKLNEILQKLNARVAETVTQRPVVVGASALVNHSGRIDLHNHQLQQHVSPRKRILRDMEKVSLDDHQSTKRSRAKGGNNGHGHVLSPPTPTPSITTSNHTQHTSNAISACGATQQINFPSNSALTNNNKVLNGIHNEIVSLPPPVTQATSRPISSYSITSLLSHNNNNNNSIKSETNTTKDVVIDHQRTTHLCSPKSPPSFHPSTSKPSSAFSSNNKKKSPTYSGGSSSLSPIINHSQHTAPNIQGHYNGGSSSLGSPVNYGRSRSPDLSPSPDQAYTRYRQAPYGLSQSQSSVSSPTSSAIFHPYLPTLSSRASPSGALSPPSVASDAHRYRYGSPNHQQYVGGGAAGSQQSSGSPLAYSRYSPSAYSQISPQHYTSKTAVNSNVYNLNSNTKGRDSSPNGGVSHRSTADPLRDTATSSSYGGGGSNAASARTVPKKTAALRQSYGSPVSSPSVIDPRNSENYYKSLATQSNEQLSRKYAGGGIESTNLSRSRSPTELQKHYEKEYRMHSSNASVLGAAATGLGETDGNSSSMIRPAQIPSLQHTPPSMYYMYHPQPAASAAVYYQSLAYAANAVNVFRNPMWLQYPSVHPSRLGNPLLAYGGGGMTTSHANHPWGAMSHPAMLTGEAASLLSIKEEPSSGKFSQLDFFFIVRKYFSIIYGYLLRYTEAICVF